MFKYILRRFGEAIPVLFIIATATFFMLRLAPGGPFDQDRPIPEEIKASLDAHYGLNLPLTEQYFNYMKSLLHGDLGPSFKYPGWSVNEIIADKLPVSLELGLYALSFALVVGVIAGTLGALFSNSFIDFLCTGFTMCGICLPTFVIGPLMVLFFALYLNLLNASGWHSFSDKILPTITLGLFYSAYVARLTRGSLIDILKQDFMRTAKAKGLSFPRQVIVHGLRNALAPVVSYLGPAAAGLIAGSFVTETVFLIPGLGRFFVTAATNRDYTLVLGTVLCFALLIVVFNLISDLVLVYLNPREKFN